MGSLISSKRRQKTKEPDFGTYHHSTSVASKKVRTVVKIMFTDAFASIPFRINDKLRILDVECGLGFLSSVSAEFYKNARIGIDTFEHASLKSSSLEGAKENARALGLLDSRRTKYLGSHPLKSSTSSSLQLWEDAIQGLLPPFIMDASRLRHNG